MRYLSLAFTVLLSLFILPSVGWAAPNIIIQNVTANCPGPTITITINPQAAGFYLRSGSGLYVFFDGVPQPPQPFQPAWMPSNPPNNPATFSPSPPLLVGPTHTVTVSSSSMPGTPLLDPGDNYKFTVASCGSGSSKGMTWTKGMTAGNNVNGVVTVSCAGCNPYTGDTPCTMKLPLLCFLPLMAPQPTSTIVPNQNDQWSGGLVGTTPPYAGNSFPKLYDANQACRGEFKNSGWRVAEFHDGGGSNFQAYGNVGTKDKRFWVDINDQPGATCWQR
jgi:hypothetical protein